MAKKDNPPEVRIEEMAQWAAKFEAWSKDVNEQLADLTAAMVVSTEEHADSIALQLADLRSNYESSKQDYLAALDVKAQLGIDSDLDDRIARIEAEAMLEVSAVVDEKGKAVYSNADMRQAAITVKLDDNEVYKGLVAQKRQQQRDLAQARAVLDAIEMQAKDYGRAVDNLTSRLDNLTARFARGRE